MVGLMMVALAQMDVQVRKVGEGEFAVVASTEKGAIPERAVVQFLFLRERFSPVGDQAIMPALEEVERAQVLVQGGRGSAPARLLRPGVYHVELSLEPEHQIDLRLRSSRDLKPLKIREKVIVGDGGDWAKAILASHSRLAKWFEEAEGIVGAGVTEKTPERLEKLLGQMERGRAATMLGASYEVLYEQVRDMVSGLAYPDRIIREAPPAARRPTGIREAPDPVQIYGGQKRTVEQNVKCNAELCRQRKQALDGARRFELRETMIVLLTRAILGEEGLEKLAAAEQTLAEAERDFTWDVIRKGKPEDRAATLHALLGENGARGSSSQKAK